MLRQGDGYVLDIRNGYRYLPAFRRLALHMDSALQNIVTDWNAAVADDSTPASRWWHHAGSNGNRPQCMSLQRIQMDDIGVDTLPQLLRMEDRSSMAFSREARVPLHVIESGVSLPDHLNVNNGWSKFAVCQVRMAWSRTRSGCGSPRSDSRRRIALGLPATSEAPSSACSGASCAAGGRWTSPR
jgi:hypothetical protein